MNAPFLRPIGCPAGVDPAEWRKALVDRIEQQAAILSALVDALDLMDGDADFEPWLAAPEPRPGVGSFLADRTDFGNQERWCDGGDADREEENEHGGDVQDEPHDEADEGSRDFCLADEMPDRGGMSDDDRDAAWGEGKRLVDKARSMLPPPTILPFPGAWK